MFLFWVLLLWLSCDELLGRSHVKIFLTVLSVFLLCIYSLYQTLSNMLSNNWTFQRVNTQVDTLDPCHWKVKCYWTRFSKNGLPSPCCSILKLLPRQRLTSALTVCMKALLLFWELYLYILCWKRNATMMLWGLLIKTLYSLLLVISHCFPVPAINKLQALYHLLSYFSVWNIFNMICFCLKTLLPVQLPP